MAKRQKDSSNASDPKMFNPAEMRRRVEQLKREGRMPTREQWQAAVEAVRKEFRPKVLAARRLWEKKHGPEPPPFD